MFKLILVLVIAQTVLANEEPERFVVGGRDASRGQFPHVVSFRSFPLNLHGCSGSIVSSRWVLTAAHCVQSTSLFEMVVGSFELSDFGTRFLPEEIVIHPNYRTILNPFVTNDIALVKTDSLIEFNELIQPVRIGRSFVGGSIQGTIAGFGATEMFPIDPSLPIGGENIPKMSEKLQYIRLNVISNLNCNARISLQLINGEFPRFVRNSQLCTFNDSQQGVCYGDSGSALLINNEVVGVASRVILPCARGSPDVFIRVSEYANWINSHIRRT